MNKITNRISLKCRKFTRINSNHTLISYYTTDGKDEISEIKNLSFPDEPTTCCMSGCANCVWIAYAEELSKHFKDGGDRARKQIMEKIADPNLRMFLLTELKYVCK